MSEWSLSTSSDDLPESSAQQYWEVAEVSCGEDAEISSPFRRMLHLLGKKLKRRQLSKKLKLSSFGELSAQLGALVNDPAHADVQFLCKDGVRVHASRMLLAARSAVFQRMLGNGMVESNSKEIHLANISSSALLPTLEFLYAGDFHNHQPTGSAAVEVFRAAQYFLLPNLERRAYLRALRVIEREMEKQDMLELFCVAATDADMCNSLTRNLLLKMVAELGRSGISLDLLTHLSREQLEVYVDIARMWWGTGKRFRSCVGNYHRLRLILLWCAGAVSTEAAQALAPYLPEDESKLLHLSETSGADNFHSRYRPGPYVPDDDCGPLLQKERVKTCVSGCQDLLQLHKVPLHLLATIIEPLDIVHPVILCDAYQRQEFRTVRTEMSVLKWDTGRGFVLECREGASERWYMDDGPGFARTSTGIATDAGACAWEFIVEEWCVGLELGFYDMPWRDEGEWYHLGKLSTVGWALTEKGLTQSGQRAYRDYGGKAHLRTNSRVRVHVENNTCSFIIDGVNYGVAWENIPPEVFPACTPAPSRIQGA